MWPKKSLHKVLQIAFCLFYDSGVDGMVSILGFLMVHARANVVHGRDTSKDLAHSFGVALVHTNNIRIRKLGAQLLLRSFAIDDEAEILEVLG